MSDPVYYRIYLSTHTEKLTVVCMQSFDEGDYNQARFYKGGGEEPMRFDTEEEAIAFLNERFKVEYIEDEFLSPDHDFFQRMEK